MQAHIVSPRSCPPNNPVIDHGSKPRFGEPRKKGRLTEFVGVGIGIGVAIDIAIGFEPKPFGMNAALFSSNADGDCDPDSDTDPDHAGRRIGRACQGRTAEGRGFISHLSQERRKYPDTPATSMELFGASNAYGSARGEPSYDQAHTLASAVVGSCFVRL